MKHLIKLVVITILLTFTTYAHATWNEPTEGETSIRINKPAKGLPSSKRKIYSNVLAAVRSSGGCWAVIKKNGGSHLASIYRGIWRSNKREFIGGLVKSTRPKPTNGITYTKVRKLCATWKGQPAKAVKKVKKPVTKSCKWYRGQLKKGNKSARKSARRVAISKGCLRSGKSKGIGKINGFKSSKGSNKWKRSVADKKAKALAIAANKKHDAKRKGKKGCSKSRYGSSQSKIDAKWHSSDGILGYVWVPSGKGSVKMTCTKNNAIIHIGTARRHLEDKKYKPRKTKAQKKAAKKAKKARDKAKFFKSLGKGIKDAVKVKSRKGFPSFKGYMTREAARAFGQGFKSYAEYLAAKEAKRAAREEERKEIRKKVIRSKYRKVMH